MHGVRAATISAASPASRATWQSAVFGGSRRGVVHLPVSRLAALPVEPPAAALIFLRAGPGG
jgi:hypothetical protein